MPDLSRQLHGVLLTDRTRPLDETSDLVWASLEDVGAYRSWWPWLRRFEADALVAGACWLARIRIPMPWDLRLELRLDRVEAPRRVEATVTGDVAGTAAVTVEAHGHASVIRLESALVPRHRLLRAVNRVLPSVSRRLHDRVVDSAFEQFADRPRPDGVGSGR